MSFVTQISANRRSLKGAVLGTLSATPLMLAILGGSAGIAFAQAAPATPQTAQNTAQVPEEIVVTGSRVVRDGYQAPTPVSVVTPEEIQANATSNIFDYVNTLPSVAGSTSAQSSSMTVTNGQGAIDGINLRGLGVQRTLVLINGQRTVGSILTGVVDTSELPQQLIQRVDVETGGASATYGSDALAGVVNYILDTNFTGVKGEVSGGVTTYGDDRNWKVNFTGGTGFANDRGHFLISSEASYDAGVMIANRPWNEKGWGFITNPNYTAANGQPQNLLLTQVGLASGTYGGIIDSGPLKGIAFGPGGVPYPLTYGSVLSPPLMAGGAWQSTLVSPVAGDALQPEQSRQNVFTRASYQINDNVEIYGQASWAHLHSLSNSVPVFYPGPGSLIIHTDNAFIPAELQASALAGGSTFTFGTFNGDLGLQHPLYDRRVLRFLLGGDGKFDAFDTSWKWDGYLSDGENMSSTVSADTINENNYNAAIDAVRAPNGTIVCRSNLNGGNPGCVPYDVFGNGVNSQAAINYVQANPFNAARLNQKVAAANVNGEPFSDWAGPVSLALGVEHREESTRGISDPQEYSTPANPNPWFLAVPPGYSGKFAVTEGSAEVVMPLAKDQVWAKSLDLDGAVRETGYSTFGTVTTWKVGANWAPIDDIRFRARQSHDIREPTLVDLYQAPTITANSVTDPFNNNATVAYRQTTQGNVNLRPEDADTTGVGMVISPSFFQGFNMSVDWFRIDISNGINTQSVQQLINDCFAGNTQACSQFSRTTSGGNPLINFTVQPLNYATELEKGLDLEASYQLPLQSVVDSWNGNMGFRVQATHYYTDTVTSGIVGTIPVDNAGNNSGGFVPKWRYVAAVNYVLDPITVTLTGRGLSGGVYNNNYIQCSAGCPASTPNHTTVSNNQIAGAFYLDLSTAYKIHLTDSAYTELFFNVRNLFNKDPAIVGQGPGNTGYDFPDTNVSDYDVLGRVFRAGIRFKM